MTPNFHRALACLGLLAGLASCNRAAYSFSGHDTYLPAPTAAITTPADLPAATEEVAAPTPGAGSEAISPARRARHRAPGAPRQQLIQPAGPVATAQAAGTLPHPRARRAAHRRSAASGALISERAADGLGQLAMLLVLYVFLVVGAVVLVVTKLIKLVVRGRTGQVIYPAAPRATP